MNDHMSDEIQQEIGNAIYDQMKKAKSDMKNNFTGRELDDAKKLLKIKKRMKNMDIYILTMAESLFFAFLINSNPLIVYPILWMIATIALLFWDFVRKVKANYIFSLLLKVGDGYDEHWRSINRRMDKILKDNEIILDPFFGRFFSM